MTISDKQHIIETKAREYMGEYAIEWMLTSQRFLSRMSPVEHLSVFGDIEPILEELERRLTEKEYLA